MKFESSRNVMYHKNRRHSFFPYIFITSAPSFWPIVCLYHRPSSPIFLTHLYLKAFIELSSHDTLAHSALFFQNDKNKQTNKTTQILNERFSVIYFLFPGAQRKWLFPGYCKSSQMSSSFNSDFFQFSSSHINSYGELYLRSCSDSAGELKQNTED